MISRNGTIAVKRHPAKRAQRLVMYLGAFRPLQPAWGFLCMIAAVSVFSQQTGSVPGAELRKHRAQIDSLSDMADVELRSLRREREALSQDSSAAAQRHSSELSSLRDTIVRVDSMIEVNEEEIARLVENGNALVEDSAQAAQQVEQVRDSLSEEQRLCTGKTDSLRSRLKELLSQREEATAGSTETQSARRAAMTAAKEKIAGVDSTLTELRKQIAAANAVFDAAVADSLEAGKRLQQKAASEGRELRRIDSLVRAHTDWKQALSDSLDTLRSDSARAAQILNKARELDSLGNEDREQIEAYDRRKERVRRDSSVLVETRQRTIAEYRNTRSRIDSITAQVQRRLVSARIARQRQRTDSLIAATKDALKRLMALPKEQRRALHADVARQERELARLLLRREGTGATGISEGGGGKQQSAARLDTIIVGHEKELAALSERVAAAKVDSVAAVAQADSNLVRLGDTLAYLDSAATALEKSVRGRQEELDALGGTAGSEKGLAEVHMTIVAADSSMKAIEARIDSLGTAAQTLRQDSAAVHVAVLDTVRSAGERAGEVRQRIDSLAKELRQAESRRQQLSTDSLAVATRHEREMTEKRKGVSALDSAVTAIEEKIGAEAAGCKDALAGGDSVLKDLATALQHASKILVEHNGLLAAVRGRIERLTRRRTRLSTDSAATVKRHREQMEAFGREGERLDSLTRATETRQADLSKEKEKIEQLAQERAARRERLFRETREELKALQQEREQAAARRLEVQKRYDALLHEERVERSRQDSAITKAQKELTALLGTREQARTDSANAVQKLMRLTSESHEAITRYDSLIKIKEKELTDLLSKREAARKDSLEVAAAHAAAVQHANAALVQQADQVETKKKAVTALLVAVEKAREDHKLERRQVEGELGSVQNEVVRYDSLIAAKNRDLATLDARNEAETAAEEVAAMRREAQEQLVEVYNRLHEDALAARELFDAQRELFEDYLDAEAFQVLQSSIREALKQGSESPDSEASSSGRSDKPPGETDQNEPEQVNSSPPDATVYFSSMPPGARVYIDGRFVGNANADDLRVWSGEHTVEFVSRQDKCVKRMHFKAGKNPVAFGKIPCN